MSIASRAAYAASRSKSAYSTDYAAGSQAVLQQQSYPKSVITFAFYDQPGPPAAVAASMSDHSAVPPLVRQSPQRRAGRARAHSPKAVTRHQVGVKKLGGGGGGGGGGKVLPSQRTSSASPTTAGHYTTSSGYFTITAYLPNDGGKRLKVYDAILYTTLREGVNVCV